MTIPYRHKIACPHCRGELSLEEPFKTWLRENKLLDSVNHCIVIGDCDLIVYRYGSRWSPERQRDRSIRWHQIVEVKTFDKEPSRSQDELHFITNQLLTTSKKVERTDTGLFENGHINNIRHVYVDMPAEFGGEKQVLVLSYGVQLLQLSGRCFATSERIRWNGVEVSLDEVTELLSFKRHPVSLQPLDHAKMHKAAKEEPPTLFSIWSGVQAL